MKKNLTVKVKALGWTKKLVGKSEGNVSLSGETLSDLLEKMKENAEEHMDKNLFLILVNGKGNINDNHKLKNGDTITLLPVVSGG
ncbi:MAG: MoaD/ThiS family protein [Planctomycetota bacterium]